MHEIVCCNNCKQYFDYEYKGKPFFDILVCPNCETEHDMKPIRATFPAGTEHIDAGPAKFKLGGKIVSG